MQKQLYASLLLVLVGCGSKRDDAGAPSSSAAPSNMAATPPEGTAAAPVAAPPVAQGPDTTFGSCRVVTTGAASVEQVSGNTGPMALAVNQWMKPETRKIMEAPEEGMILNCTGDKLSISFMTSNKSPFPMKPASYPLRGLVSDGEGVAVLGELRGADGFSFLRPSGTFEVTEFDAQHIAGRASFKSTTIPDKGEIQVEVTFDMKCRDCK